MSKKKLLKIMVGIIYYALGIIGFGYLFILSSLEGIIKSFHQMLFLSCFVIAPLVILILPIVLNRIIKVEYFKSFISGCISIVIYIIAIVLIRFAIIGYMSDFTILKWTNEKHANLRYLMIDDLEREYNFIGKNKTEAISVLGKASTFDNSLCYYVKSDWIDSYYYCFKYDDTNVITEIYKTYD